MKATYIMFCLVIGIEMHGMLSKPLRFNEQEHATRTSSTQFQATQQKTDQNEYEKNLLEKNLKKQPSAAKLKAKQVKK